MNSTETNNTNMAPFYQEPSHDEIALAAFLTWEKEGRPLGRDMEYWLRAEAELRTSRIKKAEVSAAHAALPWPRSNGSRTAKKSASATLATPVKRTTTPKTAKRAPRAA